MGLYRTSMGTRSKNENTQTRRIYSTLGTLFVEEEEKLSNNIMCIWINVIKRTSFSKR